MLVIAVVVSHSSFRFFASDDRRLFCSSVLLDIGDCMGMPQVYAWGRRMLGMKRAYDLDGH